AKPDNRYGMPIPSSDVHSDLPRFDTLTCKAGDHAEDQDNDAPDEVQSMQSSQKVIELAARPATKEDALSSQLAPRIELAGNKATGKQDSHDLPRKSSPQSGSSEAEPFFHQRFIAKVFSARQLESHTAEDQQQSVPPK